MLRAGEQSLRRRGRNASEYPLFLLNSVDPSALK